MSDTESISSIEEDVNEVISLPVEEPITTNIQSGKPKKPRSEKQILALEKARATRKLNTEKKHKLEYHNKQLIEDNTDLLKKLVHKGNNVPLEEKPKSRKKKKQPTIIYADDDEPSDEEVIIVKKKPKKRKPKKKIVYESPSESSSEEEEELSYTTNDIQKVSFQQPQEYHFDYSKPLKYSDLINYG